MVHEKTFLLPSRTPLEYLLTSCRGQKLTDTSIFYFSLSQLLRAIHFIFNYNLVKILLSTITMIYFILKLQVLTLQILIMITANAY